MGKALFDTNILIDYLNSIDAAKNELSRYASRAISTITSGWKYSLAPRRTTRPRPVHG